MKLLLLIFKNLRRNKLRLLLTASAIIVLVAGVVVVLTVLMFLQRATTEQAKDVMLVITERYRIPSRFDRALFEDIYAPSSELNNQLKQVNGFDPAKYNYWHFAFFTLDPEMKDLALGFFVIATVPEKIPTMIDGMQGYDLETCKKVTDPPPPATPNTGILMGASRMAKLGKKVGDTFKAKALSHRGGPSGPHPSQPIEMEFTIVGEIPDTNRWTEAAFMDFTYLDRVLKEEQSELDGKINLGWLMVGDQQGATEVSRILETYHPTLKCETGASAVSRFLEGAQSILLGFKYVVVPALVIGMALVVAIAISLTVRERVTELAVMKVLGFSPRRILTLVLGEAVLVGVVAGVVGTALPYLLFNSIGGIKFPIAFFPTFFVRAEAFLWGPPLGALTAVLGSFLPAWRASGVKVSEVFAKVA
jgi:putative ABC transport system permease protein